jgi:ACS family tartrate transporter-like MFS transporter
LINSIGNVGGFVGPSLVGVARQATNSFEGGLLVIAASMIGAAIVAVSLQEAPKTGFIRT